MAILAARSGIRPVDDGLKSASASVGALASALVAALGTSYFRTHSRALWIFDSLGLNVFISVTGISAGPNFVRGIAQAGIMLPLAGAVVVCAAHLVAVLFGSHVLKINSGVLFGTCAGARTSAGALAAIRDVASSSSVPTLGYVIAYVIGNVLLALSGTILATAPIRMCYSVIRAAEAIKIDWTSIGFADSEGRSRT